MDVDTISPPHLAILQLDIGLPKEADLTEKQALAFADKEILTLLETQERADLFFPGVCIFCHIGDAPVFFFLYQTTRKLEIEQSPDSDYNFDAYNQKLFKAFNTENSSSIPFCISLCLRGDSGAVIGDPWMQFPGLDNPGHYKTIVYHLQEAEKILLP